MEEGYDIFDEKYVRWLLLKYPDKVPSDWLQKVPTSSRQQVASGKGYQHVASYSYLCMQQLMYCNRFEGQESNGRQWTIWWRAAHKDVDEGYNIFDEKDVRWLLLQHPHKVPSDWLQKVPTSSKQRVATGEKLYTNI